MFKASKTKNILLKFFIAIFIVIQCVGFLAYPLPAKAQAPDVVAVYTTKWTWEKVGDALLTAALGSALHASSYFFRKVAYDTATWIASGGKGQNPLAFDKGSMEYLKNVAGDAAGDAISKLGDKYGLNLCSTPDLGTMPFIQIGLHSLYQDYGGGGGPVSDCSWSKLSGAWSAEAFEQKYGPGGSKYLAQTFNNSLRFEESDFGIAIGAKIKIDRNIASGQAGGQVDQLLGQGFKPVTSLISGKVTDPAQLVKEESKMITNKQGAELSSTQLAGVYGTGMLQIIPMAASVFLNTLTSKGLQNLQRKLLNYNWGGDGGDSDVAGVLSYESSGFASSRKRAEAILSDFLTVNITQVNSYNILEEFSSCPNYPVRPGLNNCVMDSGLRQALEESSLGEPLTISDALEKNNYLHGDWFLISPERTADILDKDCYQRGYCYPNIQKLRRSRILPLGFEIAATLADPDDPSQWTLKKVVDGFYDCAPVDKDTNKIPYDPVGHPYCHLIDPNWVLKAPDARCGANVYSSNLADDSKTGIRAQECVDVQTCIKKNSEGSCDFFGYCTKEKNVWRFNADTCEEQYNTCTTFVSSKGQIDSYLARTLDYGDCNVDSVGCSAFSTEQKGDSWVASINAKGKDYKEVGRSQTIFFNDNISNYYCSESTEGCNAFYLADQSEGINSYYNSYDPNNLIYLQKAPDYLGCYDIKQHTPEIDWPQTSIQLLDLKPLDKKECDNFAQVCLPSEVDCDSYRPLSGASSVDIPGVIGNNYCNSACVGYETFRQNKTAFEPSEFPLYFIPDNADSCSVADDGCDEFTNIDKVSAGGEGLEYYSDLKYCERPEDDNQKVFYSWEGSKSEGYVLKLHTLRPVKQEDFDYLKGLNLHLVTESGKVESYGDIFSVGSPAYANEDVEDLESNYEYCNAETYNSLINKTGLSRQALADCRALYDKKGNVFYRILSKSITVSDDCHPLRKTNSNLYVDSSITADGLDAENLCVNIKGGRWDGNTCERCYAGGKYENGSCIYWAIDAPIDESNSCFAEANGCREYRGNAANNLERVADSNFDIFGEGQDAINEAKSGWMPDDSVSVVSESIQVGLQSLQVKGSKIYNETDSNNFIIGDTFELSFWAKGNNDKLSVYFEQTNKNGSLINLGDFTFNIQTNSSEKIGIGSDWRQYTLGPVTIAGLDYTVNKVRLMFSSESNNPNYFLDNLELYRVTDSYYLIKDSWKQAYNIADGDYTVKDVPAICDSTPKDPFPGEALGCRAYEENSTGNTVYAIGFDSLCREDAIGCRAMFDTRNSSQTNKIVYNLWCVGDEGKNCELIFESEYTKEIEVLGTCFVATGEKGCFVEGPINKDDRYDITDVEKNVKNSKVVDSTVIVPADTPDDEQIYLTYRDEFSCTEKDKGCQKVVLESQILPDGNNLAAYEFSSPTYILNDPDNYGETLCRSDQVGCGDFTADSEKYFFKDPVVTGNSFCEYKGEITKDNGFTYSGWFLTDVGYCGGDSQKGICASSDDCGEGINCGSIGQVPCYDNYQIAGGKYGIWSNNSPSYDGRVGICPTSENGCTELVDPQDSSDLHPEGQPYYVIYADKLTKQVSDCEGKVSLKEGCVLFDKTDEPNLLYNSADTYIDSEEKDFVLVNKITKDNEKTNTKKDTNTLLKVIHDRECGEWLSCQGYTMVNDTQSEGNKRRVCQALQLCQDGDGLKCDHVAPADDYAGKVLTEDLYVGRDISWQEGRDLSGYSLFNQYQIGDLDFVTKKAYNATSTDQVFLGYVDKNFVKCGTIVEDGDSCGQGVCIGGKCVYPTNGYYKNTDDAEEELYNQECRGYPEEDSPFVDESNDAIVKNWNYSRPEYSNSAYINSNVCQLGQDCACDYLRVGYGESGQTSEEKFFEMDDPKIFAPVWDVADPDYQEFVTWKLIYGICKGGLKDGRFCETNTDCEKKDDEDDEDDGKCSLKVVQRSERLGWKGYCLERDYSRHVNGRIDNANDAFACLTWLPLDSVPSSFDIFNSDETIGYTPPKEGGGEAYCTEMIGWQNMEIYKNYAELSFPCYLKNKDVYDDLKNEYCTPPIEEDVGELLNFGSIQLYAWDYIEYSQFGAEDYYDENGVFVSQFKNNFLSRVDITASPSDPGETANKDWTNNPNASYYTSYMTNRILVYMALGGYNNQTYAPLFPDREKYGIYWVDNYASKNTTMREQPYVEGNGWDDLELVDTGVVRHRQNMAEDFITKDMIESVSLVPLWPSEEGGDNAYDVQIPQLGRKMSIDFSVKYPKVGEKQFDKTNKSTGLKTSTNFNGANKNFGKYWILSDNKYKEKATSFSEGKLEGYILVWFAVDPKSVVETIGKSENTDGDQQFQEFNLGDKYEYTDNPFGIAVTADMAKGNNHTAGNHFIALEFLFEEDSGKFVGYRSRNASWIGGERQWGYATAIVFTLKPMCVEAVEVYKSSNKKDNTNKAWTDRLWVGSDYDNYPDIADFLPGVGLNIKRDNLAPYFGSINSEKLGDKDSPWFYIFKSPEEFDLHAGHPLVCLNKVKMINGLELKSGCEFQTENYVYEYTHQTDGVLLGSNKLARSSTDIDLKYSIDELFAKAFVVRSKLTKDNNKFVSSDWVDTETVDDYGYTDAAFTKGTPPIIFYPSDNYNGILSTYKNKFAVNSVGAIGDKLYGEGTLPTTVSFYAWADHNQMPLRKIMVDWREDGLDGSGTILGSAPGYYQNAKPYCQDYECVLKTDINANDILKDNYTSLGLTCSMSDQYGCPVNYTCHEIKPRFGNQTGDLATCQAEPVKAFWNYSCDATEADKSSYDNNYATSKHGGVVGKPYIYKVKDITLVAPLATKNEWQELLAAKFHNDPNELICVFQPRVQVLDNWGWCTGTCDTVPIDGNSKGCYSDIQPVGWNQCDGLDPKTINKQWLSFEDIIVVAP